MPLIRPRDTSWTHGCNQIKVAGGFSTYLRVVILVDHINQIRTVDLESLDCDDNETMLFQRRPKVRAWKFDRGGGGEEEEGDCENGEAAGEDEGGGVRAVAVSAEGDAWALEGPSGEDPPQGLRELAQCYSPYRPSRRRPRVSPRFLSSFFNRSQIRVSIMLLL